MNNIEELIINNKIEEAIDIIYEAEDRTDFVNKIIVLKSDLTLFKKKSLAGLLSHEEESRSLNKIRYRLLEVVSLIKDEKSNLTSVDNASQESSKFNIDDEKFTNLTRDQFKVLNFIDKIPQVRVSGNAGSGKTLVAVEKAIRLSKSNIKVIILCHNPILSKRIQELVSGFPVSVSSFGGFIKNILNDRSLVFTNWNNYYEPTQDELLRALDIINNNDVNFPAIIIDEGQDFRDTWWVIIEAMQSGIENPITYIFHDDNQALLPERSVYPFEGPIVNLSKNCRNAGNIHEFIKYNFHTDAPETSQELSGLGRVKIFRYLDDGYYNKTLEAIDWIRSIDNSSEPVILLAGNLERSKWEFGEIIKYIPKGYGWRQELVRVFSEILPNASIDEILLMKGRSFPDKNDVEIISDIAKKEYDKMNMENIFSLLGPNIGKIDVIEWKVNNSKMKLEINHDDLSAKIYFFLKFLCDGTWVNSLRKIVSVDFIDSGISKEINDKVAVFDTASFKGLEAHNIIVVSYGNSFLKLNELYVASSRAKRNLAVVIDKKNENFYLPKSCR